MKIILKKFSKLLIVIIFILLLENTVYASEKKEGIESFPEDYRPYLYELKNRHPNWNFIALYTNLDWKYVIDNENIFGKNLVPKSYSDVWKNTKEGEYNVEVDAGWVDCSRAAVEYAMDPRNFLNEIRIFQFEELSYDSRTNNLDSIEKILYGTEFYNNIVEYRKSDGSLIRTDKKYSDEILSAAKTSAVSSYHLASRIKQEVGPFLSHSSISGIVPGYEGLYNFYNIGATSSSEPMGAIINGLKYARDGKGASQNVKDKYRIPWNTKSIAITGGGIFIGESYINKGQNNIYLQKFDVNDEKPGDLFWHQYMTNVLAPYSESYSIYNGYKKSNLIDNIPMNFVIPVYDNMPETRVENLNISKSDFVQDNTNVYADVSTSLNLRNGPGTSYETLYSVKSGEVMKRIAKGIQSGERWDKVVLSNGITGYVFSSYVKEVEKPQITKIELNLSKNKINKGERINLDVKIIPEDVVDYKLTYKSNNTSVAQVNQNGEILGVAGGKTNIVVMAENGVSSSVEIEVVSQVEEILVDVENLTLQKGESYKINTLLYPKDASNKEIKYESLDNDIAIIDNNGNINAISNGETQIKISSGQIEKLIDILVIDKIDTNDLNFNSNLNIEANIITGIDITKNTVFDIKDLINTNYEVNIYNKDNKLLSENDLVGTGSYINISNEGNTIIEYKVLIYGDVNGDGKINSVDLLVLQRHILEIEKFNGIFLRAGNINKNGKNPSSIDSLLIQRHILDLQKIEQR